MGFNHRKMEDRRHQAAENEAAVRRATDAQVLEDPRQRFDPDKRLAMSADGLSGHEQPRPDHSRIYQSGNFTARD
jgi:hypothetical protein